MKRGKGRRSGSDETLEREQLCSDALGIHEEGRKLGDEEEKGEADEDGQPEQPEPDSE